MKNLTKISFALLCVVASITLLSSCQKYRQYPLRNPEGFNNTPLPNHQAHTDTIALSALPTVIKTYFTTNYPKDTLKHALVNRDSSYVVVSADTGIFVTVFNSSATFEKRTEVYPHVITSTTLTQAELPANVSSYLTATYPAYVFDATYEIKLNGTTNGYSVFIDVGKTKYLVEFDGSGNFSRSFVVW